MNSQLSFVISQFFNKDIFELQQTGRAIPLAVAFAAVMLQGDGTGLSDTRQPGLVNDLDAVEHDRFAVERASTLFDPITRDRADNGDDPAGCDWRYHSFSIVKKAGWVCGIGSRSA